MLIFKLIKIKIFYFFKNLKHFSYILTLYICTYEYEQYSLNYQLRKIQIRLIILEEWNWNFKSGSASTSSADSSRSESGWLEEEYDDAVNNINSTIIYVVSNII